MTQIAALPQTPDARSAEILQRIRQAFAEKGFDGASMQDLARAAGMSVGNFYRYFPSKAAIVEAMVSYDMTRIESDFAAILTSVDPLAALRAKLMERIATDCRMDGQLWAEIAAASLRKPEVAAVVERMETVLITNFATVFARVTGLAPDECLDRFGAQARFLMMMIKAAATRIYGREDDALQSVILRCIDRTLEEIAVTPAGA